MKLRDLAAIANGDPVALELADEVVGHRLAQVGAAVKERDERAPAGEPDCGLAGGVAAADDRDARGPAELRLGWACRVEDARALVVPKLVEREPPVLGSGRENDRPSRDLVPFLQLDDVAAVAGLELDRAIGRSR